MSGCGLGLFPVAVMGSVVLGEEVTSVLALALGHGLVSLELVVCGLVLLFGLWAVNSVPPTG